ncbi:MAG: T9SS type A sorting domain-containing protein [Flavobacteriales bacterium]|nr:T9SS type A sorting domain-containing protein [Flavobacteriales bacterium]
MKLDNAGSIDWQHALGGSASDWAHCVQQTNDGGFIAVGLSASVNGDVTGQHGGEDFWVVKLTATGALSWQKSLGGTLNDGARYVEQTSDGGYIVAGYSRSSNGDVAGQHGDSDCWVVKLDASGNLVWQKALGGTDSDEARCVKETSDGGFVVFGYTQSNNGDVSANNGGWDYWLVKLDANGSMQWQHTYGGTGNEFGHSITLTSDGGFFVVGETASNNGDVSGNHGASDIWAVKLNDAGVIEWQRALGGTGSEWTYSAEQVVDGGYVIAGRTDSNDGDVNGLNGGVDFWILRLDAVGSVLWQEPLGGTSDELAYAIRSTTDGGYLIAGGSSSVNGDVSGNHGNADMWVVRLGMDDVGVAETDRLEFSVVPNPAHELLQLILPSGWNWARVWLFDSVGRSVLDTQVAGATPLIRIGNLTPGIYSIRLIGSSGSLSQRVMLE